MQLEFWQNFEIKGWDFAKWLRVSVSDANDNNAFLKPPFVLDVKIGVVSVGLNGSFAIFVALLSKILSLIPDSRSFFQQYYVSGDRKHY